MSAEDVTLLEYIDVRIRSLEDKIEALSKYNAQHFDLNEKAIRKAEEAMLIRLETMNEFRAQINQERISYATKDSVNLLWDAFDSRLKKLENANAFSAGKLWMVMAGFAAIPTILALIALFR